MNKWKRFILCLCRQYDLRAIYWGRIFALFRRAASEPRIRSSHRSMIPGQRTFANRHGKRRKSFRISATS